MQDNNKDSLFSRHLRIIENSTALDDQDRIEKQRLEKLQLAPLELPKRTNVWSQISEWINNYKTPLQVGIVAVALALVINVSFQNRLTQNPTGLRTKGSLLVTVRFERNGEVKPFDGSFSLQDGDKVGASVMSSEDAIAFWAITDSKNNLLSHRDDVLASQLQLEDGKAKTFSSSFELVSPNEGENLVVVVCTMISGKPTPMSNLFDSTFVSDIISKGRAETKNCIFVGYRLREMQ